MLLLQLELLRLLGCDVSNASTASSLTSQLTPQPVQTVTPIHQVCACTCIAEVVLQFSHVVEYLSD